MDREKLKEATGGRGPRRGGGGPAQVTASRVSDALLPVSAQPVMLGGREFRTVPLNVNALISIEERGFSLQGFLEEVAGLRPMPLRFLFWLCLRPVEGGEISEEELGALIPVRADTLAETMERIMRVSGLVEEPEGNAETPAP